MPGFGRWFPRFELQTSGELAVQLRPAPPIGGRVRVAVHDGPDPRTAPRVKGPDLELLGKLKESAAHRADEILLLDHDGTVLEAAYSALAWWEDDTLCFPPSDRPLLPSVTAATPPPHRHRPRRPGRRAPRSPPPTSEATTEAWLVNALHGIRPIHAWSDSAIDPLPNSHSTTWQIPPRVPGPRPLRQPSNSGWTPHLVGCPLRIRGGNPPARGLTPESVSPHPCGSGLLM